MKTLMIPHWDDSGNQLRMDAIINAVPENDWMWSVIVFEGIGAAPNGLTMAQFEDQIYYMPQGYKMSWYQFKQFLADVEDIYDCLICAAQDLEKVDMAKLRKTTDMRDGAQFGEAEVIIELFDSSYWTLYAQDASVMEKWIRLAG